MKTKERLRAGYRVTTNGKVFRVQGKHLWRWVDAYVATWTGDGTPAEFDTVEEAQGLIDKWIDDSPYEQKEAWEVVKEEK